VGGELSDSNELLSQSGEVFGVDVFFAEVETMIDHKRKLTKVPKRVEVVERSLEVNFRTGLVEDAFDEFIDIAKMHNV